MDRRRTASEPILKLAGELRVQGAQAPQQAVPRRRGAGRPGGVREAAHPAARTRPTTTSQINSGLGEAKPLQIIVLPIVFEGQVQAVMELASFTRFSETYLSLLDQLTESIGVVLNTIQANMRTEELLVQSQSLAEELQAQQEELTETNKRLEQQAKSLQASEELLKQQQEELQQTNEELEEKARLLQTQNEEVERKNHEVEQAKRQLEEKARAARAHVEVQERVPGEHVARAAHAAQLAADPGQAAGRQSGRATSPTSRSSSRGRSTRRAQDLLTLINDILDLSKIESGMMTIDLGDVPFTELARVDGARRSARWRSDKGLDFDIDLDREPAARRFTPTPTRLQQVLKNLLGNAFKFTEQGGVTLRDASR